MLAELRSWCEFLSLMFISCSCVYDVSTLWIKCFNILHSFFSPILQANDVANAIGPIAAVIVSVECFVKLLHDVIICSCLYFTLAVYLQHWLCQFKNHSS